MSRTGTNCPDKHSRLQRHAHRTVRGTDHESVKVCPCSKFYSYNVLYLFCFLLGYLLVFYVVLKLYGKNVKTESEK